MKAVDLFNSIVDDASFFFEFFLLLERSMVFISLL